MDLKVKILKAVANEKRVKIMNILHKNGRMELREIARIMDIPEATACRHLKILENVNFVKSTIQNGIAEYWINNDKSLTINQKVLAIVCDQ
ncbi:MAG: winged helix-turn-helix domain-containing protein [candidate division WOR-3 bacterium]